MHHHRDRVVRRPPSRPQQHRQHTIDVLDFPPAIQYGASTVVASSAAASRAHTPSAIVAPRTSPSVYLRQKNDAQAGARTPDRHDGAASGSQAAPCALRNHLRHLDRAQGNQMERNHLSRAHSHHLVQLLGRTDPTSTLAAATAAEYGRRFATSTGSDGASAGTSSAHEIALRGMQRGATVDAASSYLRQLGG